MSKKIILFVIILIAAILRFLWLDKIPHSINGDELHYALSTRSFALTGKDISQTTSPIQILLFHYPPNDFIQAELPYFLLMPTTGLIGFSLVGNALPNAVISTCLVIMIYLITKYLVDENTALISAFVTAVNPWFISMGRTSYEVIPATFFYLCTFYILLKVKGWKILFAFPFILGTFYSYIATKLILFPIMVAYVLYCYLYINKRKYTMQYITLLILTALLVTFFFFQIHQVPSASRLSEIMTPNSSLISDQVNTLRKTSINNPLLSLFDNKLTIYIQTLLNRTFNIFSLSYLFLEGDYFSTLGKFGLFYAIDPIFLIIGTVWLFLNKKNTFLFFLILIAFSIIPQLIHNKNEGNFTPHITLLFPFFIIFISIGIQKTGMLLKQKKWYIPFLIIVVLYLFLIANFLNTYFYQIPMEANFFNFPDRVLSQYINLSQKNNTHITLYSTDLRAKFEEYIFYNNLYTKKNAQHIAHELQKNVYTLGNVTLRSCNQTLTSLKSSEITIVHAECAMPFSQKSITIPQPIDSGGVYQIYNDTLCKKNALKHYISNLKITDLNPQTFSTQTFCQTYITS